MIILLTICTHMMNTIASRIGKVTWRFFARYELHDDSGSIEGELFISKGSQPAEDAAGSIRILENGTTAIEQELSSRQNGRFPFELEFRNSDTPVLNVQFRLNGEEFSIDLGTIDRHADHPEEPDVEDLAELDKPMQWRLAIESGFADYSDIPKVVSGFGTVLYNPNYYREITSPVDGQINSENFSVVPASGTRVQSGDRLASISPSLPHLKIPGLSSVSPFNRRRKRTNAPGG
jgi:hypothetical protein